METLQTQLAQLAKSATDDRMAKARAAKANKAGKSLKTKPATPETPTMDIRLPEDRDQAIVYAILHATSVAHHTEGYTRADGTHGQSYVVPTWLIMKELRDTGYLAELGERPTVLLGQMIGSGHVKQAGKGWIPTCFDTPYVKGARGQKGPRSSNLRRSIDALIDRHIAAIDGEDEQGTGTEG